LSLLSGTCVIYCGFYTGNWPVLTSDVSNVFTNYYPSGGAVFTKPGIVMYGSGGAIMALY